MTRRATTQLASPPEATHPVVLPPGVAMAAVVDRLALRIDELAESLGVSRRSLERVRSAGKFPKPDAVIGRMPVWKPETIRRWLAEGGGR